MPAYRVWRYTVGHSGPEEKYGLKVYDANFGERGKWKCDWV